MEIPEPTSFVEVARRYRAIFFDAFGVLNGLHGMLDGVPALLERLNRQRVPYWVLTNDASMRPENMAATIYESLGLPRTIVWKDKLDRPHHVYHGDSIAGLMT